MQRIVPCLWFDTNAEAAVKFYTSVFKNSKVLSVTRYTKSGPRKEGMVLTILFELDGQRYMALNGGPEFKFSEAVSLMVYCKTQKEIDYYWEKLSAGGQKVQCGWLTDKFGLSWQIVAAQTEKMLTDKDPEKRDRVMRAIMGMVKLDIAELKRAYAGK